MVAVSAGRFSHFVSLSLFFTAGGHSRVLENSMATSVVGVADAYCFGWEIRDQSIPDLSDYNIQRKAL